jgi:lathosterol oxidase
LKLIDKGMVLCSLPTENLLLTWGALAALGLISLTVFSTSIFVKYYVNPTYEQWRWKSNPKYPTPEKVRDEITQMIKACVTGTLFPALALTLARTGKSKAFCNAELGMRYDIISFFVLWIWSDFYEWGYHWLGHRFATMWEFHRAHHAFFNPSPFAVIADEYVDMAMRSLPMLAIPLVVPINMDILFGTFAVFFYGYGTFIHWGYEVEWLSAHNPIINTPFQHYCHHAISGAKNPYHTGFFFKIWDQLMGSVYPGKCFCCVCDQKAGNRTRAHFAKIKIPDYSVLLQPTFYLTKDALKFDQTTNDVKSQKEPELVMATTGSARRR